MGPVPSLAHNRHTLGEVALPTVILAGTQ